MEAVYLTKLEKLNQLRLTEEERTEMLEYFSKRSTDEKTLEKVNTDDVERMVHVIQMTNVLREDVSSKMVSRDDLLSGAPESSDGYWQVPRLLD